MGGDKKIHDYDLDRLARQLGQDDPAEWRWKQRANDNGSVTPPSRADLFLAFTIGALLGAVVLVYLFG
jgi:hypothetical protein